MATEWDRLRTSPFYIPKQLPEEEQKKLREAKTTPILQSWTTTGYPIVDGRYNDFSQRRVREITAADACVSGPPTVDVYWHNSWASPRHDGFFVRRDAYTEAGGVTSYVVKLGDFFKQAGDRLELYSLNITTYSVVVLVGTQMLNAEFMDLYEGCGLGTWHGRGKSVGNRGVEAAGAAGQEKNKKVSAE
ncbi:uncharacterized protein B0I36DRAFT_378856 [Microdochium trichocladiopsis]|uniref:Uncharacterized protein n=1 Tax=Microdochium trichocladiopsis TaxID=1682393 RepID=A0A9P8YIN1_9PEZI|nr:uncharacterized protein B0I36DRAFT_378856 [Microdochium trichocladiopsis]KAH7039715.1 hypothetical protein B0I36DRAFT_378856 [Microdochium trichocladiopsis]